ncbi:hypothetical protein AVEN_262956-1 [Araneus ventricosus]|uniref:Uncharacterized protein n=1 Tax=Araneus ventricosus TaxID=182803 RepID=A0A4Y2DIE9_ARAVE|nr:hypothetical protein AVEN_262956-1 [Araneus ventricosus]
MHLDQKACENYYCSQVLAGGGPYFQGVSHQRGYGMFSNLFRFITPIAMKAGKYLGKHILSAGSKKVYTEIFPVASLSDKTPIEFYVSGSGEHYLDLAHTLLHLQVKIKKKNGTAIGNPDQVAPINYLLHTLFSECSVTLNDKQVSSQANYAYRCIFDALLSPRAVQESMLTSGLFYKDVASKHDSVELANVGDNANSGYQTRYNICKDSKLMDMIGPLHFDLGNQSKCLINSVNLRIKLERNNDSFALMSSTQDFRVVI